MVWLWLNHGLFMAVANEPSHGQMQVDISTIFDPHCQKASLQAKDTNRHSPEGIHSAWKMCPDVWESVSATVPSRRPVMWEDQGWGGGMDALGWHRLPPTFQSRGVF